MIFIVGEALANMYYFSLAGGGLVGGFFTVIVISFLNVVLSFSVGALFGRMCFYIWKRHPFLKFLGIVVTISWVIFLVLAHSGVAHSRDYLAESIVATGPLAFDVLDRIVDDTFGFNELNTWLLFGIGLALGWFSLLKGMWLANDPYPGYGSAGHAIGEATKELENGIKKFRQELDAIDARATSQAEALLNSYEDTISETRQALSQFDHLVESFDEARHQVEMAFITCVAEYRRENVDTRTHETPEYFAIEPQLDGSFTRDFEDAQGILEELLTERDYAARSVGAFRDAVQKELSARRFELSKFLDTLGGVAKDELIVDDPFFVEHGGASIMTASDREPKNAVEPVDDKGDTKEKDDPDTRT